MIQRQFIRCILLCAVLTVSTAVAAPAPGVHAAPAAATMASTAAHPAAFFDKTRVIIHLAIAYGVFHHWVYKPFKAGDSRAPISRLSCSRPGRRCSLRCMRFKGSDQHHQPLQLGHPQGAQHRDHRYGHQVRERRQSVQEESIDPDRYPSGEFGQGLEQRRRQRQQGRERPGCADFPVGRPNSLFLSRRRAADRAQPVSAPAGQFHGVSCARSVASRVVIRGIANRLKEWRLGRCVRPWSFAAGRFRGTADRCARP